MVDGCETLHPALGLMKMMRNLLARFACFIGWTFQRWPSRMLEGVFDFAGLSVAILLDLDRG